MDELIAKYAEILRNAKIGDYTYEGILASFAREAEAVKVIQSVNKNVTLGPGSNTGHGHVWPRPDGSRARCGGVGMCKQCSSDWAAYGVPGPGRDSS